MIIYDLIFLKIFRFLQKIIKDVDRNKNSSFLYVSAYFALTIILTITAIGNHYENIVSKMAIRYPLGFWMSIFILSPFVLYLRYYKMRNIADIEKSYDSINEKYKLFVNIFIIFLMLFIPILTFAFYH